MIRLKTYKHGYLKTLLFTFSFNIVLQSGFGQDLNVNALEGESDQESQLPRAEEPDSLFQAQPALIDSALGQDLNNGAPDDESDQESQLPRTEEPDSLSQAQPDSIEMAKYASVDFKRYEDDANEEKIQWKIKPKRIFYGIAVAVPIYLILSQDKDKDASASKVGPPPDWPNN